MVTTCDQSAVRYAALDAGATDFLTKPIDPVETKSRVRNLLKLREAQNKLRDRVSWARQRSGASHPATGGP